MEPVPQTSTYKLELPAGDRAYLVLHVSKLTAYNSNDPAAFPSRHPPPSRTLDVEGEKESVVQPIVDEKGKGRARRYLVK
jgi:hypothetical protein